jgi:hypothetical protein
MRNGRVRRLVSDAAGTAIAFTANAAKSVQYGKVLLLAALTALVVVVAVPIFIRADMPSMGANDTLKCYDRAGNYQPCPARASASLSRSNGPPAGTYQPASWATVALYQRESSPTIAVALSERESPPPIAAEQPASAKANAPATKRSITLRRRTASANCGRHLIPCVFSALRRGVTHLASVAATEAGTRPSRAFRDRDRPL